MNPYIIDIRDLHKTYANGFEAIKGISLQIHKGAFFGLLGPNGAGKSTLINSLVGLVQPTRGEIRINGFDIKNQKTQAQMNIGVVAQEILCDPFLSVYEMLCFQSGFYGLKNNENWIDEIIDNLGLSEKAQTPCRLLSGGMKRRVMVAQALVHKPPVIVLDEPTAGVDVQLRNQLWQFIQFVFPQKIPHPRNAGIFFPHSNQSPLIRPCPHGTKLIELKIFAILSHTALAVKHPAAAVKHDAKGYQQKYRTQDNQAEQ